MRVILISLAMLPGIVCAMNPMEHRRQLIIESQLIQIRDTIKEYQPIMDHVDYENILYSLYVIEVMLH